jgi:hypothetical protein
MHGLVDGLHLIEKKADRVLYVSLTLFGVAVQQQSFFDSFPSFPGWWLVRGSSELT